MDGLAGAAPSSSQASSASSRRRERALSGCGGVVLVDQAAAMVAIDADRRQVADPGEPRRGGDRGGEMPRASGRPPRPAGSRPGARRRRSRRVRFPASALAPSKIKGSMPSAGSAAAFPARLSSRRLSRTGRGSAARNAPRCSRARRRTGSRECLFACRRILPKPLILRCEAHRRCVLRGSLRSHLSMRSVCGLSRRNARAPIAAHVGVGFRRQVRCRRASMRAFGSNRPAAHTAIARTSGEASPRSRTASPASPGSPELPSAIATLRTKRSRPVRLTGVPANFARKAASSSRASSASGGATNSSRCTSRASRPASANLFQGQTARQSSQPKTRLPIPSRSSGAMCPLCSIVRYEMQRRLSRRYGAGKASVGHTSRQRRQEPQRSGSGSSAGSSAVVKIEPRKSQLPNARETSTVCLPCQPSPAAAASGFSITGAVSTNTLASPRPAPRGSRRAP